MKYQHVLAYVSESIWAITPEKLRTIVAVLATKAAGDDVDPAEVAAIVAARRSIPAASGPAVAVLPLWGVIAHRAGSFEESSGGTSSERFGAMFDQAMADPGVSAVVIDCDSPGGTVAGTIELAEKVYRARGRKPIVGVVNAFAASAAYWVLSQCDEIVALPSSQTGSIGVISSHTDLSEALAAAGVRVTYITSAKHKAEGAEEIPLSAEALGHYQSQVDYYHTQFVRAVARGRHVPIDTVRGEQFGLGRVFNAQAALDRRMIDRIGTMEGVIGELANGTWQRPMRAETETTLGYVSISGNGVEPASTITSSTSAIETVIVAPDLDPAAVTALKTDWDAAHRGPGEQTVIEPTPAPASSVDRRRRRLRLVER